MKTRLIILICSIALTLSCQEKSSSGEKSESLPRILVHEVFVSYDNCEKDSAACTYVYIEYPEFSDTTKSDLNNLIADKLRNTASNYFREESVGGTFEHIAHSFIKDYQSFVIDFPGYQIGWYVRVFSEITYESEGILSFRIDSESYTGGAHPNSTTEFFVIDKNTNRELATADIISDTSQFKILLELEFRRIKGMSSEQSFADRGFYINDGDFLLNNNIGISDEKVMVHFNPYEIAPYSEGATTVEMNKSDMQEFLKVE